MIEFVKSSEKKNVFFQLVSLYGYEASFGVKEIGQSINEEGMFLIPGIERFTEEDADSSIIYVDGKPVGFVAYTEQGENSWMMDEIFITKTFRTQELFDAVLDAFAKEKHGQFQTHILKGQQDVCELVEHYFKDKNLKKEELDPIAWLYTVEI